MHHWFERWTIVTKLRLMALLGLGALLLVSAWQARLGYEQAWQARQDDTRHAVEVAHGVLAWAHGQETSGAMSREQAQQLARSAVGKLRYGNGEEYFWINDMQPRVVLHPIKPELDGKDAAGIKDPNGKALFLAFVDKVRKEKQGFVDYQWPKPGKDQPVDKISYVKGFEPWGWVVGSGLYVDDLQAAMANYLVRLGVVMVLAALVMLVLTGSITRSIVKGLSKSVRVARAIAAGDISQTIHASAQDEVGELMRAMDTMCTNLREMVRVVQQTSHSIETAASEIASGNQDLAVRTEETATSLRQTAAAITHINDSAENNAQSAREASELSTSAAQTATTGNEVVSQVVQTMDQITESSRRIGDIIGVIDGIAFQTNILALNAAVEAARAGEQGRGFAVVATEVRALAQRSANAAREIKTLISESVERVSSGHAQVAAAGGTMGEVVGAVQRVNALVESMREVNLQLTTGVGQVNQAMAQLEHGTTQNAAMVEQAAAATQSLREQAHRLSTAVDAFRLG